MRTPQPPQDAARRAEPRVAARLRGATALAGRAGMVIVAAMLVPGTVFANPEGGVVTAGSVAIRPGGPGQLDIVQTTSKAIIDWQRFGVKEGEHTRFQQPDAKSITLNRVVGPDPSAIMGRLSANGQVWLVNPNGILFGRNAQVDVAGLIATTHDIRNDDFLAGRYNFEGRSGSTATVENEGVITVAQAGLAAFVAPGVANRGVIEARLGEVALASGRRFVVDLFGDQKINLALDAKTDARPIGADGKPVDALVRNDGQIFADGGRVRMSAAAAKGLVDSVVNMSGRVQARSVEERDGEIILSGDPEAGTVRVSGTLDVAGADAKRTGGAVTVTGDRVELTGTARVDASGAAGGGAVLIGGDLQGGRADAATYALYNIRPGRKPVPPARNLTVEDGAVIAADATNQGKGGKVILWSDEATRFDGVITAKGGPSGGDGGFVETSGKLTLRARGAVDASSKGGLAGHWLLDPRNVTITNTGYDLSAGGVFDSATDDQQVYASSIVAALQSGNDVTVTTGSTGAQTGNLFVTSPIAVTLTGGDRSLTLKSANDLFVTASITAAGDNKLNLTLNANSDATDSGAVEIQSTATITTNNGALTIGGGTNPATSAAKGDNSSSKVGVYLNGSAINAGTGAVSIRGEGGGYTSGGNIGVSINGGSITTSSGAITIIGQGGSASNGVNTGVQVGNGATITTDSGSLTLTGTGGTGVATGSSSGGNHGVSLLDGSVVRTTSGSLAVNGTGGTGTGGGNHGVHLAAASEIRSTTGSVSLTAVGGNSGSLNEGLRLEAASKISSYGSAPISITASTPDTANSIAMTAASANNTIGGTSATGAITFTLDSLDANSVGTVRSAGALTIRPSTLSTPINVATGSTGLQLTSAALGALQDGFSSITIGRVDGTGDINVGTVSFMDPLVMATGGDITVSSSLGTGSGSHAGSIALRAGGDVAILGSGLSTYGEAIILNADRDATDGGAIETSSAVINSHGGAITMGGGADPSTIAAKGSATRAYGVRLSSGSVSSEGGNIIINGEGKNADGGHGVSFVNDLTLDSGAGTVQIKGKATATTGTVGGVVMDGNGNALTVRSAAVNTTAIQIEGDASAANATDAYGIGIRADTDIKATGSAGGVTLAGKAGRSVTAGIAGVSILQSGGSPYIEAASGPIALNGTAGSDSDSLGIALGGPVKIGVGSRTGGSASNITLTADSMNLAQVAGAEIKSGGTLTLRPETRSVSVGLAGGAGSLSLSSASLGVLASGFSEVVIGDVADYGAITVGGAVTFASPLRLVNAASGSGGVAINGALSVGSNRLTVNTLGPVTQTAGITADSLEMVGSGASYTLTGANSVNTIAANVGSLAFRNVKGFGVSTVGATSGVTASGLASLAADSGSVWQGDPINAASLELKGTDSHHSLVGANGVDVLAANVTELAFRNTHGFAIGTAGSTTGVTTPGALTSLSVDAGTVSQTAGITAGSLELSGTSAHFTLTGANTVDALAGSAVDLAFRNTQGFVIGTAGGRSGLSTPGALLSLRADSGAVTQTAAVTAGNLELLGASATYTLSNTGNSVGQVAGRVGALTFRNSGTLTIGSAGGSEGVEVNGTTLGLTSGSGSIQGSQALRNVGVLNASASGGDVNLGVGGVVNSVGAVGDVQSGGAFTLTDSAGGLTVNGAVSVGGDASIRTIGDLTLTSGASIRVAGAHDLSLVASGNFVNNGGSSILNVDGRWLIYAADRTAMLLGGLAGGTIYSQTFSSLPPASVTATGNNFVVASADPATTTTTTTPETPISPPVSPPVAPPVSPPPVSPPVSPPVTPPVSPPPVSPPVSPPVTPPVSPPPVTPPPPPVAPVDTDPTVAPSPPPPPPVVAPPPPPPVVVSPPPVLATTSATVETVLQAVARVTTVVSPPPAPPPPPPPLAAGTTSAVVSGATIGAVPRGAEPKTFLAALESPTTSPSSSATPTSGSTSSGGASGGSTTASSSSGTSSSGTASGGQATQESSGQAASGQSATGQAASAQSETGAATSPVSPPPPPPPAPATVALAGGGTATFSSTATAAYTTGATLSQPGPQVLSSPVVQAAAGGMVQAASGGTITQAVTAVASSGMTITEQKAVFQSVPVATIVSGLVNSPDPVAKQVGGLLQTTSNSGRAAYAEVKSVLKLAGYDQATTKTYLAMYQRVRREQRTRSLAGALRQLTADPSASDLFPSHTADGTPPPNIVEFSNAGARRTRAIVRGLIDSNERVAEARVNGQWVFVDEQGRFGANLTVAPGQTEAVLTVIDDTGVASERRIAVQAPPAASASAQPTVPDGRKIALMIAVDTYRNPEIPALGTPAADVAEVSRALNERLGYETRVLRNPTKAQIADALRKLGREVTEQDQVMVYYAGHGYELAETGTGYWLPSDAETTSARNWVSNNDIARFLNRMPAKQVLLVSDSCYSGAFTKEQKLDASTRARTGEELRQRRSVMALSSGGDEPVADGEVNSPFATALMTRIRALPRESGGFDLYEQVREDVTRDVPQTPQYGVIKAAGYDEGGDYVLSPTRAVIN